MKKLKTIAITAILILVLASLVNAAIVGDSAKIEVTLISQEPDPAEPGQVVDVRFKVENFGGGGTDEIIFEIIPEYPFSLYSGEVIKNLGSMQAYQNGEEGIILLYKLKVDADAVEGDNYLDIRYNFDELSSNWIYEKDYVIRVRTHDIVLEITGVKSDPETIPPGSEAKLSFGIKNAADSLVTNIKVKLDLADDDTPFAPKGSTTEKKIYQVQSRTEKTMSFDLIALPDADSGTYKIPIDISYEDLAGTTYSKSDIISLTIGSTPDLFVGVDSSELFKGDKIGMVTLKFVNKGLTDLKFLNVRLESSDEFEVISPEEVYIGNVDSDDYETVDFDLHIKTRGDKVMLPLKLEYMDANNNRYVPTKNIELKMYSSSEAKKYGISKERGIGGLIIVIIVVGGLGIYIWRKKKKGEKINWMFWKK